MPRRAWYWLIMTLHELRCSPSTYNVWKNDGECIVVHDACGKVWSA